MSKSTGGSREFLLVGDDWGKQVDMKVRSALDHFTSKVRRLIVYEINLTE